MKRRRSRHIAYLFIIGILSFVTLFGAARPAHADVEFQGKLEDSVRSLQKDYFMGVLHKKTSDGRDLFDFTGEKLKQRQLLNYRILTGQQANVVSLYDRFGGEISYPMYLGETVVRTGASDKIYTAVAAALENELSFTNLFDLVTRQDTVYTNKYYQNRPQLKDATCDPRVKLYQDGNGITVGQDMVLSTANYFLGTAKLICNTATFFISDELIKQTADALHNFVQNETYKNILNITKALAPIVIMFLLFFIVKKAAGVFRGKVAMKSFVLSLFGALMSYGLIYALLVSPETVINISEQIMKFGDNIGATALNKTHEDDEIVYSSNLDNVTTAALWEEAIFKPWVYGTFGSQEYKNLYTTYSGKDGVWDISAAAADAIGDIGVPVSSNTQQDVRNWAALAYSCSTKYHINAIQNDRMYTPTYQDEDVWPKASLAGSNSSIFTDDFRWIDADLKVGQFSPDADVKDIDPYINVRQYEFDGVLSGLRAIWLSVLLIPIMIIGIKKLVQGAKCLMSFVILLFRSCVNVITPDNTEYELLPNLKYIATSFVMYFWYIMLLFASISLYEMIGVSENFLVQILYLIIVLYLCVLKPQKLHSDYDKVRKWTTGKAMAASAAISGMSVTKIRKQTLENTPASLRETKAAKQTTPQENIRRGGTITKERYEGVLNKEEVRRDARARECYEGLMMHLSRCPQNADIYNALTKHRMSQEMVRMDQKYLDIGVDEYVSDMYLDGQKNKDYDPKKAKKSRDYQKARASYKDVQRAKEDNIAMRMQNINQYNNKELRHLKRDIKHVKHANFANNIQTVTNELTGNRLGGSIIPPIVKLYCILGVALAYLAGYLIAVLIGA